MSVQSKFYRPVESIPVYCTVWTGLNVDDMIQMFGTVTLCGSEGVVEVNTMNGPVRIGPGTLVVLRPDSHVVVLLDQENTVETARYLHDSAEIPA